MVENLIPYLSIGAYLLLTLIIGIIGYRRQKNIPEDYFLADRKIGSIVLFLVSLQKNLPYTLKNNQHLRKTHP
ncbi:MAG: hypothetical protein MGF17_09990 [Trichodesmium sp. MAG_R04]|nr:hypothetical protein [Trichodesmium sp. MAG_R04]